MTEAGAKNINEDWLTFCDTGCVRNGSQLIEHAEDRRDQNRVTEFATGICDTISALKMGFRENFEEECDECLSFGATNGDRRGQSKQNFQIRAAGRADAVGSME
jgi:hypothetical protein